MSPLRLMHSRLTVHYGVLWAYITAINGAQVSTPSRGVDEQSFHGVAHRKSY
jgi:hypothetical protein